eukprot:3409154-Prymnesium_polylepis.2
MWLACVGSRLCRVLLRAVSRAASGVGPPECASSEVCVCAPSRGWLPAEPKCSMDVEKHARGQVIGQV